MRRIWLAPVALVASGCSGLLGIGTFHLDDAGGGGGGGDGNSDVPMSDTLVTGDVGPDASATCFGPTGWQICLATPPTTPVTLTTPFSTDTNAACLASQPATWTAAGQPNACIVVGTTVSGSGITVTGTRPLVIVASNAVTVTNVLAGAADTTNGPGAPSSHCAAFPTAPSASMNGGGAGAGASFMSKGGDGGLGDLGGTAGTAPAPDAQNPTTLRGGCVGQPGASGGLLGGAGGAGGKAGGAVYLVAGATITITGDLFVGGGGGRNGNSNFGGGGGAGTGGSIVLYAPTIIANNAKVSANGGGGGGGANNGTAGVAGGNALADSPNLPAAGGNSGFGGGKGRGGNGSFNSSTATSGSDAGGSACGGGGGGGAGGYIRANVQLNGAIVSPPLDIVP